MIRLDKFLAEANAGSRSQVKNYIRKGRVTVSGETVKNPDVKIREDACVTFDGTVIRHQKYYYFMLHKPAGVVSATEDNRDQTVLDLLKPLPAKDLFPVGRLDKDTEGLLLITNDGQLAHQLLSPKKHVDKTYFARVTGRLTKADRESFKQGLDIGDEHLTKPAELVISGEIQEAADQDTTTVYTDVLVTIYEGRFHQIKRMFQAVGKKVVYLKRLSMGRLQLDESLAPGDYRELSDEEVHLLYMS